MTKNEEYEERFAQWEEVIRERVQSGKKVKDWCAENGINERKYYYWVNRINMRQQTQEQPGGEAAPITFVELQPPAETVVSAQSEAFRPAALIRVNHMEVEVFPDATEAFLRQLLAVLRDA